MLRAMQTTSRARHPHTPYERTLARWLLAPSHRLLHRRADDFPASLEALPDPPDALYVDGDASLLHLPQVAIVGARSATPGGLANARAFAGALARAGFVVTSGLASGIDGAAHEAALDAGGRTIAVCATGLDLVYPRRHESLAERIRAQGALVSEQPLGMPALRPLFPQRNRLIAALSLATLVIEAGLQSGSLITARLAGEIGRDVFALPGSIHNPVARGCHRLIRDGAMLIETVDELVEAIAPQLAMLKRSLREPCEPAASPPASIRPEGEIRLLAALGYELLTVDELVDRSGLTTPAVSSMLVSLELDGQVASSQGRYQRVRFDKLAISSSRRGRKPPPE